MRVTIDPSIPYGSVIAPPSKSMAHRLLICAGLAHKLEPCCIFGLEDSQDILATIDCLSALGACINRQTDCATVYGIDPGVVREGDVLPCRECGSTLRFFVPLCLLLNKELTLTGSETLLGRPMGIYEDICREQGLYYKQDDQGIHVKGPLHAGDFRIPGNVSSQFVSGLLFALPLLKKSSTITLVPPIESRPYIDMTIEALATFGVTATWENETTIAIPGGQRYRDITLHVEGDYSNAAFLDALNYLEKARARVAEGETEATMQANVASARLRSEASQPSLRLAEAPSRIAALPSQSKDAQTRRNENAWSPDALEQRDENSMFISPGASHNEDNPSARTGTLRSEGCLNTRAGARRSEGCEASERSSVPARGVSGLTAHKRAKVHVTGLRKNSLQGDSAYRQLFPTLAAGTPTISLANCPDLGPILIAVAAANNGATFTDCARLAIKESNRGQAMAEELAKFGVSVAISADNSTITVNPETLHAPNQALCGHNDHRIVMALATLASATGGIIEGAQAIQKSFPSYFDRLVQLGIGLHVEE